MWQHQHDNQPPNGVCSTVSELVKRTKAGEQDLDLVTASQRHIEHHKFSIAVIARLRATSVDTCTSKEVSQRDLRLPLHQQLQWIQDSQRCSKAQARIQLFGRADGAFLHSEAATEASADQPADLINFERFNQPAQGVLTTSAHDVTVCAAGIGLRKFYLDRVLGPGSSQAEAYEHTARDQVATFLNGGNATVLCYGMTGTGKTFTLFGPDGACAGGPDAGMVPLCVAEVQAALRQRKAVLGVDATLSLSYVEVYGERVKDLLHPERDLSNKKGTAVRTVINGDAAEQVSSQEQLAKLLLRGDAAKTRAATAMNATSSRAHTLILLQLTQVKGEAKLVSWLCLADLGGSEQLSKSHAEGERRVEAVQINLGLLALKECIQALNEKRQHVPFANSKLTSLLAPALGGNCKTAVIVTAAIEAEHAAETVQSLRFGELCSNVQTETHSQLKVDTAELDSQIKSLEADIKRKEHWDVQSVEQQPDAFGDGGGVRQYTQLAGAESERELLETLLAKKAQLLTKDNKQPPKMPEIARTWVNDPVDLHQMVKRPKAALPHCHSSPLPQATPKALQHDKHNNESAYHGMDLETRQSKQLKYEKKLKAADLKRAEREEIKKIEMRAAQVRNAQKKADRKKRVTLGQSIYSRFLTNNAKIKEETAKLDAGKQALERQEAENWYINNSRGNTPVGNKVAGKTVESLLKMGDAPELMEHTHTPKCSHDRVVSFTMGDDIVPDEFATRTVAGFTADSGW